MKRRSNNVLLQLQMELYNVNKSANRQKKREVASGFYESGQAIQLSYEGSEYCAVPSRKPVFFEFNPVAVAEEAEYEIEDFGLPQSLSETDIKIPSGEIKPEEKVNGKNGRKPALKTDESDKLTIGDKPLTAAEIEKAKTEFENEIAGLLKNKESEKTEETPPKTEIKSEAKSQETKPIFGNDHKIFDQMSFENSFDLGSFQLKKDIGAIEKKYNKSKAAEEVKPLSDLEVAEDFDMLDDLKNKLEERSKQILEFGENEDEKKNENVSINNPEISEAEGKKEDEFPVSPENGGRSVDISALKPADIIISTTKAAVSAVIKTATKSPVSQAMLYVGNGEVIESINTEIGVEKRTMSKAIEESTLAVAFRHPDVNAEKAQKIIDYAEKQKGKKYNKIGAVRVGFFHIAEDIVSEGDKNNGCTQKVAKVFMGTDDNAKFFCSELVFDAFRHAGINLTDKQPYWNSPQEIAELTLNRKLIYIGHLKTS